MNTKMINKRTWNLPVRILLPAFTGIILTLLVMVCIPLQSQAGSHKLKAPKMNCHAYVVMDAGSGEVLFGQDEDKVIYPASTAKLMTAIVCIEKGNVNSRIKTTDDIIGSVTPGTYCLGLYSDVTFTFRDLLSLSLISSAADATDSLAAGVFGSKEACVEAMNDKCRELGLTKTHFDNPVGSDIGAGYKETYATAREMALITRYAMAIPLIRKTVRKSHYETSSGQEIYANSTNLFLRDSIYYDEDLYHIIGSKSGTTNAAGHVFIATATDDNGHEVICAFFGNETKEDTFYGIRKLLNYTFKKVKKGKIELAPKCDDVRASKMRVLYDTYADLHAYPAGRDGKYHPDRTINRTQFARLINQVDKAEGNPTLLPILKAFANDNPTACVSASKAASLIQRIYPRHLSDEEVEAALADCSHTDLLNEEEKEAFAVFVKAGILPDESCKNALLLLNRRQALVLADKLADYQTGYGASYPLGKGLLLPVPAAPGSENNPAPTILWNVKWKKKMGLL